MWLPKCQIYGYYQIALTLFAKYAYYLNCILPLQDYLLPLENVKFSSKTSVRYGGKNYNVLVTDRRLILFAQRGHFLRSDDVVSERLDRIQGVEYSEKGLLSRTARILIQGISKIEVQGSPSELKALFQNIQSVVNIEQYTVIGDNFF